jgi:hypothetical protein
MPFPERYEYGGLGPSPGDNLRAVAQTGVEKLAKPSFRILYGPSSIVDDLTSHMTSLTTKSNVDDLGFGAGVAKETLNVSTVGGGDSCDLSDRHFNHGRIDGTHIVRSSGPEQPRTFCSIFGQGFNFASAEQPGQVGLALSMPSLDNATCWHNGSNSSL